MASTPNFQSLLFVARGSKAELVHQDTTFQKQSKISRDVWMRMPKLCITWIKCNQELSPLISFRGIFIRTFGILLGEELLTVSQIDRSETHRCKRGPAGGELMHCNDRFNADDCELQVNHLESRRIAGEKGDHDFV